MPFSHPTALTNTIPPRIAITGLGLVSPLGLSAWATFKALLDGRTLTQRACEVEPVDIEPVALARAVGSVSATSFASIDPAIDLAERAGREALAQAGVSGGETLPCFLGVSKGAVHALTHATHRQTQGRVDPQAAAVLALGPVGLMAHHLQRRLGVNILSTSVAACASSLTALHLARLALLNPAFGSSRALVLTSEAALLPLFIHSYRRLGVLPPLTSTAYAARPLDEERQGFMLAELAAAVVLERVDKPGQEDATGGGHKLWLQDTAIACEDFDLVRPSPTMPALARVAGRLLGGEGNTESGFDAAIDMIHPHATGTRDQDPGELAIYESLLRDADRPPALYAAKGAVGHGLGAAGLVSLVLACLMARTRRRLPMPWLERPLPTALALSAEGGELPASSRHAIFAAGFGGHVAGAVIGFGK